ncbi:MAG: sugar phosphate nucleotidyltransferase, partial [Gemmatimonadota bacterium]
EAPMMKFVIRAGGVGTRLWPYSRATRPKQFHAMAGAATMLQEAVERLRPLADPGDIYVSTGKAMVELVRQQLPALPPDQLIVEPALRNTGPAVGLECALLEARFPGCTVASLGSDHYIGRPEELVALLRAAAEAADAHPDYLFTIAVQPTRPETGYGYVHKGEVLCRAAGRPVYRALEFTEKPDEERARRYVASGEYLWNTNMFVWRAATMLELFAHFQPATSAVLERIRAAAAGPEWRALVEAEYAGLEAVAIDNAIIERAERVATLEGDLSWGDIGSWAALTDVLPMDESGNLVRGRVLAIDARGVVAYGGRDKLIALVGVEDLVVVDTEDALLVCRRDQAQRVREILERLKADPDLTRYS